MRTYNMNKEKGGTKAINRVLQCLETRLDNNLSFEECRTVLLTEQYNNWAAWDNNATSSTYEPDPGGPNDPGQ